jgi:hypothetical protein
MIPDTNIENIPEMINRTAKKSERGSGSKDKGHWIKVIEPVE